jgi:PTS system ascorbate-specific IIB component
MRDLKILAVCGFGVGTSLLLKMNIMTALKKLGIRAEVENIDITTAKSVDCDMIFTSNELASQMSGITKPIIVINNFMDINEIQTKASEVIEKL